MNLTGKNVLVMGLGRFGGGVGVTRFLHQQQARVTVTDQLPAEKLQTSLDQLADLPDLQFHLGEHRQQDFLHTDLIVVNPAVKPDHNPFLAAARDAGVPLTSEIALLVERLPNRQRTIGVTGTAGKSTVTAMIGAILHHALGESQVHVGGNLGGSLLTSLDRIQSDHWVVLELSSFMLESLRSHHWSPHIAVLTNLAPNHLDWHGSFDAYRHAKQVIFDYQSDEDFAVLTESGQEQFAICRGASVLVIPAQAGIQRQAPDLTPEQLGARLRGDDGKDRSRPPTSFRGELLVPGDHNRRNAALAVAAAHFADITHETAEDAVTQFPGLPHRLQLVATCQDVRFFNDSKSTTPDAAILAIDSFPPNTVHIILGGYDKGANLTPLAAHAAKHGRAIYTLGTTGPAIAAAARDAQGPAQIHECQALDHAVRVALAHLRRGDVLLLSPACASWDQFENYQARGNAFAAAVRQYATETNFHPH